MVERTVGSAGSPPALAARGVGFAYRDGHGLADIDLTVGAGEIVGLLGPNGAGKSTLVRLLSGVLGPYRGAIELGGVELARLPRREIARCLAVVPQESAGDLPYTALETVLLGRHPHLTGLAFESDRDLELAHAALARLGAAELAGRPLGELSAGERQRVAAARALAQETPLLLLDEPTSFLDLRFQVELFDLLRELAAEGRAILAVLHDLSLAAEYCDRVVLLAAGRVVAAGPTAETLTYSTLTRVYGTEIYVDLNDLTGSLVVTPLSARARRHLARP
ncbi:MAG: ABC transporter ATP-binding protein [Thermoanaerobaculia bacterium]|nr:ABC transporter ATP-binding protein [Thermoanaerobaculia bacterium]